MTKFIYNVKNDTVVKYVIFTLFYNKYIIYINNYIEKWLKKKILKQHEAHPSHFCITSLLLEKLY